MRLLDFQRKCRKGVPGGLAPVLLVVSAAPFFFFCATDRALVLTCFKVDGWRRPGGDEGVPPTGIREG